MHVYVHTRVREQIGRMMVGQDDVVDGVLTALFAGGHVLLEGVPGLGKTLLVSTLGRAVDLQFSRIQFTPDNTYYVKHRERAIGGFKKDMVSSVLWMDNVWHLTSAFIKIHDARLIDDAPVAPPL